MSFSSHWGYAVKLTIILIISATSLSSLSALAEGGISIQGTRIVYPQAAKQHSLSVSNSSAEDSFLVQSWIEDASGHKTSDFIVTPPLYLSGPGNENKLRLMHIGSPLPHDRETLYYFIAKAIPSIDPKKESDKNVLRVAAATKIKLFVRPEGLRVLVKDAPSQLTFRRDDRQLVITNPTPYYVTMTNIKSGPKDIKDIMIPPMDSARIIIPFGTADEIKYNTLNDYGSITPAITAKIK